MFVLIPHSRISQRCFYTAIEPTRSMSCSLLSQKRTCAIPLTGSTMKTFEGNHTFQNSWNQIAVAFWKRYPNKHSRHVLSEDVLDRKVDSSGQLITKRLFVKTNSTPKWIERLMKTKNVHILEESIVDPIRQTLTTITRNLGMTNLMTVQETCVYKPHPENKLWTIVERKASFDSKLAGLKRFAILRLSYERYKFNIKKTDAGFQQIINATSKRP